MVCRGLRSCLSFRANIDWVFFSMYFREKLIDSMFVYLKNNEDCDHNRILVRWNIDTSAWRPFEDVFHYPVRLDECVTGWVYNDKRNALPIL